jgi:hypothetical protein
MNSINPVKHNYKLSTRNYTLSLNNNYKIPSVGLIQSFKVVNYDEIIEKHKDKKLLLFITVGNFGIVPYSMYTTSENIICVKTLRNYIRNIDFPETDFDNKLINFEHYLFSQQLKCTEHYYTLNNSDLQNAIFTSGINVYIDIKYEDNKDNKEQLITIEDDLTIEETFWDKIYEDEIKKQ